MNYEITNEDTSLGEWWYVIFCLKEVPQKKDRIVCAATAW